MDDEKMFCFQCQEAARGIGCTVRGVCGKLPQTSMYMDTLLAVTRGVGAAANALCEGAATCADGACQLRPLYRWSRGLHRPRPLCHHHQCQL